MNLKFLNNDESIVVQYSKTLLKLMPFKITIALFLMVLISLTEGISLILLVPLLQLVGINVGSGSVGQIENYIMIFFNNLGLQTNLLTVLTLYIIVISFSAFLTRIKTIRTSSIDFEFAAYLRKSLYKAITNSNWLFFSQIKSSNFAHALTNEIERISIGTGQFLSLLSYAMILVVYIIFALKIAGLITGIIFIVGVTFLLILRRRAGKSRFTGEEITNTTRDLYSSILQHMDGMKTIKSFGMQEENIKIFSNQADNVAKNYLDAVNSYADVKLFFDVGTVIILSLMVIILIDIIKLPTASLLLLIYLFVRMVPQFSIIQNSYQYFINMLPAFDNVMTLRKRCMEHIEYQSIKNKNIILNNEIKLENVSFSYRDDENFSINNINIKIHSGKTTAIFGPSGAGKSTLADLIMGLITQNHGIISIDNIPLINFNSVWREQIGYVAQETFLFNESIRFNLQLSKNDAEEEDILNALKLASAYDFVIKLPEGLDTFIGDRGVKLSGGERQRLSLARALLRKPSLLILDEATSNLDSNNEKKIINAIENIHGEMTILIIAHRLSTIKNADYIYLVEEGQVMDSGTWDELLKKEEGWFKQICDSQGIKN